MNSDLFCEDFFTTADKNTINLVQQIVMWKRKNLMLYPDDILNMLIDNNLITMVEVEQIIDMTNQKSLDISLPTRYIS
jgi:hypothetical protein